MEQEFVRRLSDETRYFRFMDTVRELTPRMLSHFTQVDHDLHVALIAVTGTGAGESELAVARYVTAADGRSCEFAIVVADDWQGKGLGARLMSALLAAARAAGLCVVYGEVLATNARMLRFVTRLGFAVRPDGADPRLMRVELQLGSRDAGETRARRE